MITPLFHPLWRPLQTVKAVHPFKPLRCLGSTLAHPATFMAMAIVLILCVLSSPSFGVTVDALKEPMKALKDDVFGGWMWAVKIGAFAVGGIFSVFKQSFGPMGIGAGTTLGIHLFDKYLGDVSAGALV